MIETQQEVIKARVPASKALDDALRCHMCYELYDGPVMLACGHSFCSMCIRTYADYQTSAQSCATCPACRAPLDPAGASLRPNLALRESVAAYKELLHGLWGLINEPPCPGASRPGLVHEVLELDQDEQSISAKPPPPHSHPHSKRQKRSSHSPAAQPHPQAPSGQTFVHGWFTHPQHPVPSTPGTQGRRQSSTPHRPGPSSRTAAALLSPRVPSHTSTPSAARPPVAPSTAASAVECPVCQKRVPQALINSHLDACITRAQQPPSSFPCPHADAPAAEPSDRGGESLPAADQPDVAERSQKTRRKAGQQTGRAVQQEAGPSRHSSPASQQEDSSLHCAVCPGTLCSSAGTAVLGMQQGHGGQEGGVVRVGLGAAGMGAPATLPHASTERGVQCEGCEAGDSVACPHTAASDPDPDPDPRPGVRAAAWPGATAATGLAGPSCSSARAGPLAFPQVAQAGLGVPAVTPAGEEQNSKRQAGATGRVLHSAAAGSGPLVGGAGLASGAGGSGVSGSRVEVPPQLVYHVLRDKELRLKLQQQGLPVDGKRQDWVERYAGYRRWVQAELDKGSRSSPAALLATFLRHQRHQAAARRTSPSLGLLQQVVDLTGPRPHCSTHGSRGSGGGSGGGMRARGSSRLAAAGELKQPACPLPVTGAAGAVSAVGQQAGPLGQPEGDCGVDVVELPDEDGDDEGRQGVVQPGAAALETAQGAGSGAGRPQPAGKVDGRGRGPTHSHQDLISQVLERMQRQKRLRSQEREQVQASAVPQDDKQQQQQQQQQDVATGSGVQQQEQQQAGVGVSPPVRGGAYGLRVCLPAARLPGVWLPHRAPPLPSGPSALPSPPAPPCPAAPPVQYGSSLTPGQQPRHNALGQQHLLPPSQWPGETTAQGEQQQQRQGVREQQQHHQEQKQQQQQQQEQGVREQQQHHQEQQQQQQQEGAQDQQQAGVQCLMSRPQPLPAPRQPGLPGTARDSPNDFHPHQPAAPSPQLQRALVPGQNPAPAAHDTTPCHNPCPGAPTAASGLHRPPISMGPGEAVAAGALPCHPLVGCGALHAPASQGQTLVGGSMGQALQLSLLYEELEEDVDGDA